MGVSTGREIMMSTHNACKLIEALQKQSFLFLVAKIDSAWQSTETTFGLKMDVKTMFIYVFLQGLFPPLSTLRYLLSGLSPDEPGRLRGYVTILFFF